jgi:hypothetical protein
MTLFVDGIDRARDVRGCLGAESVCLIEKHISLFRSAGNPHCAHVVIFGITALNGGIFHDLIRSRRWVQFLHKQIVTVKSHDNGEMFVHDSEPSHTVSHDANSETKAVPRTTFRSRYHGE